MPVIGFPEGYNMAARHIVIPAARHPIVLVINNEWRVLKLPPYKTLVVICSTVYQVAQRFFLAPFAGCRPDTEFLIKYLPDERWYGIAEVLQAGDGGGEHSNNLIQYYKNKAVPTKSGRLYESIQITIYKYSIPKN
jgi:hypothetical protein